MGEYKMNSRDKIEYSDLGKIGKKKYVSNRFKIPSNDTWYSSSAAWSSMPPNKKIDGDLLAEVEYISALVSDATASVGDSLFDQEFTKWKKIAEEITHSNKDHKRPINAIRRRVYRLEKISENIKIEIECSILRLLSYKNKNEEEFSIKNHLTKI